MNDLENKIITLYTQGVAKVEIAKRVHKGKIFINTVLKENNIPKRAPLRYSGKFPKKEIIDFYLSCKDSELTCQTFKIKRALLNHYLRSSGNGKRVNKKFNDCMFESIDTEEKAYWLGFIYADGYLSPSGLELTLSVHDLNHLQKFQKFMGCEENYIVLKEVKLQGKIYKTARLLLSSHILHKNLEDKGVFKNKSFTVKFPTLQQVPQHLQASFIRGYFDGDGSIMTKETSKNKLYVSIIGSYDFMSTLNNMFHKKYPLIERKGKLGTMYYLRMKILPSIKFLQFIYNHATIFLDRKYNLWNNYCRSNKKLLEELEGKFGEDWDVNTEVIKYVNYIKYRNA